MSSRIPLSGRPAFWLAVAGFGVALEAVALFYQYVLDYWPCVLCIHVRMWVALMIVLALVAAATCRYRLPRAVLLLSVAGIAGALVERALEINPDNAPYLDTAGWIYFKLGHVQLAREFIERSLSINPDNPEVLMHMGDILEYLGKSNEAYVYYLRAGKLR